ncbi:hypothetical protein C1166_01250 [Enterobacter bugandensis]|uniref:Uncharacterized protein n=1 Tax=Enterobacter bugandensis TaxID=881260 RepID=A0ABX4VJL6_9ENTR|nr:hypothetical protein C1166_01250 [Enterobacter bugandensis]PNF54031.1 hypothetical protein C1169_05700 [Enterobacter bugandensis]PNF62818.1 hypothetical protein C1168_05700 [Enterobacter bugandensis]PNF67457.1 hypothetical protein C1167_05700 [Enterobacter bugandensis]RKN87685.1 hypothetical protein D8O00_19475 [Enterobacter bugandensis]
MRQDKMVHALYRVEVTAPIINTADRVMLFRVWLFPILREMVLRCVVKKQVFNFQFFRVAQFANYSPQN